MNKTKLDMWKERLSKNRLEYDEKLAQMDIREALYKGDKRVQPVNNDKAEKAKTTRNICFELIESQVDSSLPMPKVTAKHQGDEELAELIEEFLKNELDRLPFERLNDKDERTTYIQGGNEWLIEWDNTKGTHTTQGQLAVSTRHPRSIIPQNGITEQDEMDYIFLQVPRTKASVEAEFGVSVKDEPEEESEVREEDAEFADDIVTQNIAFYKNSSGGIGRYSWVNDTELEDIEDYQARRLRRCKECGAPMEGDTCEQCGSTSYVEKAEEMEELPRDITLLDGTVIQAQKQVGIEYAQNEIGLPVTDENGLPVEIPIMEPRKVPFYKPDKYPLILRRSTSSEGTFLGISDLDIIADQQEDIKKLKSKITEKLLSGGSIITLPRDLKIELDDSEMKVVRVDQPQQINMIQSINLQPNVATDVSMVENNYQEAKSTLGINDSFQGKRDSTATSGTAKQFAAAQTAGRLESKRTMKNAAYADIFEMMFKFALAYADEPRPIVTQNIQGQPEYKVFDKYLFLREDAAGELYWNDEFLFSVDPSGAMGQNRETMWQETRTNYQSGAFGPPAERQTQLMFWTIMEQYSYPGAKKVKKQIEEIMQKEQQAAQMQEQMQAQMTPTQGAPNGQSMGGGRTI